MRPVEERGMRTDVLVIAVIGACACCSAASPEGAEFQGHKYVLTPTPMSWQSARDFAHEMGGYLVSINNSAESEWVAKELVPMEYGEFWIGFTDEVNEGSWKWDSG